MKGRQAEKDPDPRHVKNRRDKERHEEQEQDITEGREKQRGRQQDREPQKKFRGLASFLPRKRADGLKVSPERSHQAQRNVNQSARPGNLASAGNRAASMACRFQTRSATEEDPEKESDPEGDSYRFQRVLPDVFFGFALVGLGA